MVEVATEPGALVVTGYDREVRSRGDYLNGASVVEVYHAGIPAPAALVIDEMPCCKSISERTPRRSCGRM